MQLLQMCSEKGIQQMKISHNINRNSSANTNDSHTLGSTAAPSPKPKPSFEREISSALQTAEPFLSR